MPDVFDREEGFLLNALASRFFPSHPFPDPPADLDWERLHTLLKHHRLGAHFYVLGKSQRAGWPVAFRERLRLEYYSLMCFGDHWLGQIKLILSTLNEAGIPVIVLKGWAVIQTVYEGDYSQRVYDDMDILVHPKDVNAAALILEKLGWKVVERRPGFDRRYFNAQAYYHGEQSLFLGRVFLIGFHWGLLRHPVYDPKQIDVGVLFERAHPLEIAGIPILELSIEDHIVYNCAHIVLHHHSDVGWYRYYELAAAIKKAGVGLDWQRVLQNATDWKLILPLQKVSKRIEEYWPEVLPDAVSISIERLEPALSERLIQVWYEKTNNSLVSEHIITWLAMPGIKKRISFILEDVFPDRAYMTKYYGKAPGGVWPLLYFRRYYYLIRKFFGTIFLRGKAD